MLDANIGVGCNTVKHGDLACGRADARERGWAWAEMEPPLIESLNPPGIPGKRTRFHQCSPHSPSFPLCVVSQCAMPPCLPQKHTHGQKDTHTSSSTPCSHNNNNTSFTMLLLASLLLLWEIGAMACSKAVLCVSLRASTTLCSTDTHTHSLFLMLAITLHCLLLLFCSLTTHHTTPHGECCVCLQCFATHTTHCQNPPFCSNPLCLLVLCDAASDTAPHTTQSMVSHNTHPLLLHHQTNKQAQTWC